eukprot:6394081-Ditylum_brightwellii.AAC.1
MYEGKGVKDCAMSAAGCSTSKARHGDKAARACGRQVACQIYEEHNVTTKEEDCKTMRKCKQQFAGNHHKMQEPYAMSEQHEKPSDLYEIPEQHKKIFL